MNRSMVLPARLAAGTFIVALSALPQYTISARPGVINSIEGTAYVNGVHVTDAKAAQRMFLNPNDTLATDAGKVEVLLTPGIYLRVGDHSEVRMISPSLTDTQVAVVKGRALVEAMELLTENSIRVKVGDSTTRLEKAGLYRFTADTPAAVSIYEGKASVEAGGKVTELGKDKLLTLDSSLKVEKFKSKDNENDELFAWSKTRDQYDSASSYSASKSLATNTFSSGGGWGGYGFSGFSGYGGPGWFYNPAFSSYAWLPGDGAFFSPFGFGYYAPGFVNYAPVAYYPLGGYRGGVPVPVNPSHVPTVATTSGARPAVIVASNRGVNAMNSGIGAAGGHISSAGMARAASGSSGSGFSGRGASGGGGRAMSMGGSSAGASSGGHAGGGGHR